MLRFPLGLLAGCWLLQQAADLPAVALLLVALLAGAVSAWRRMPAWISGLLLGLAWAGLYAHWHIPPEIDDLHIRETYRASGVVQRLPQVKDGRARLQLAVDSLSLDGRSRSGNWLLQVSWRDAPPVAVGQRWEVPLRIRPVHGYRNPGGWDYAGWLYHQGVRYSAYVAKGPARLLGSEACCFLERLRGDLLERMRKHLADDVGGGMLLALTLGERSGLPTSTRQALAATGTSHLFAISGLHIGLAAAAFGFLVALLWRRLPWLCARVPALLAAAVAGLLMATGYALISGFGLPAQRALVMLAAATLVALWRDRVASYDLLGVALLAVLILDPTASLQAGFWLSFCAVAAILALMPHLRGRHWLVQALLLQTGIALALYPVLLAFDMQGSLVGPLINLLLVPLFSVLIVPASLLALLVTLIFPGLGGVLGWVAWGLGTIHDGLMQLSTIAPTIGGGPWSLIRWLLLTSAVCLLLLPPGMPFRPLGLALLLLVQLPRQAGLETGDYSMTLLDVGQGLSAVVQTRTHTLLFDTGARYRGGFNLADAVVLPYLRYQGISHIDTLVLSHGDNDHAGAAARLVSQVTSGQVWSGEPWRTKVKDRLCRAGHAWEWDGVHFEFVQPRNERNRKGNNASCVLLVSGRGGRVLIPGDIEERIEQMLVSVLPRVDVLVAPHHGSTSSSSEGFVQATRPAHVLYPVGAFNRYRFPREPVQRRWARMGAKGWRTDRDGAIRFEITARQGVGEPILHHWRTRRYWHLSQGAMPP